MDPAHEAWMQVRAIKTCTERTRRWFSGLNITRFRFKVALCLTVLLDMDAASAAAWTLNRRKWLSEQLEPQTGPEALLQRVLEDAVLAASVSYCTSWTDPDVASLGRSALLAATLASRDKRVRDFVAQRNGTDGAAVTSAAVVREWNAQAEQCPLVGSDLQNIGVNRAESTNRVWCNRWRRRCGTKMGCLRTKEPLSLQTKRDKALVRGDRIFQS